MSALERKLLEAAVRVESAHRRYATPGAVGAKLPRQDIVGKRNVEDLLQPHAELGIADWHHRLHAAVEVARHEVRGAEVVLGPAAVAEAEDARVLEELADDGTHADAVGEAGDARPQRAHAPHQ